MQTDRIGAFLITSIIVLGVSAGVSTFADVDPTIPSASDVTASGMQDTPISLTLIGASNDGGTVIFATTTSPSHGTLDAISGTGVTYTPASGYTGPDSFQFVATEGATSSAPATVVLTINATPASGTIHISVRDGATIATSTTLVFPLSGTTNITTTLGSTHSVGASSALAALVSLDALSSEFAISDLQYNSGYGSFYLRCISLPAAAADCDNWQYTVNGTGPAVGMDQYTLHDGDSVYVYFGYPRTVELSATSTTSGTPVTATAKQYDPASGTYVPVSLPYTIGATQTNPTDPWNPLERATSTVDGSGQVIFTLSATGTYAIGIKEDYYYPTTQLTITETPTDTGGGTFSGGSNPYAQTSFDVGRALAFLSSQQRTDGSFASEYLTDWAALALSNYPGTARDKLKSYLTTHVPAFASVTDYERHAMALAALGIHPYSGTPRDTIAPIVAAFDGTQVGNTALVTDDIFALFPLLHAGYTQSDAMVRAIATTVISKQKSDGSWEGGADVTAAAVQALGPLYTIPGYGAALGRGVGNLTQTQQSDGGWGNPDSTSWVMTMANSVREGDPTRAPTFIASSGKTPSDALNAAQQSDGGVRSVSDPVDTRTWSTAYAIVAASGKSWVSLLQTFAKPSTTGTFSGGSNPYGTGTTTATSTDVARVGTTTPEAIQPLNSTTTPILASSTPAVEVAPGPIEVVRTSTTSTPTKPQKKFVRVALPQPAPAATTPPIAPAQTASAADATPTFFGRIFGWFRHLFGR